MVKNPQGGIELSELSELKWQLRFLVLRSCHKNSGPTICSELLQVQASALISALWLVEL